MLSACICGYYLPWKSTSLLLIPLYLFAWVERGNYQIEKNLKIAFWAFIGYVLFFTITSHVPMLSLKGGYDVVRGLLLFPVGLAFAGWVVDKKGWAFVNLVSLLLILGSLFFPQRNGLFYSYYVNPNNAAVLLIVLTCFLFPSIESWRPRFVQTFSIIGLPVALYLLFLTNGRGAWLGLASAVVVLLVFNRSLRTRYKIVNSAMVVSALALLLIKYNHKGFRYKAREGLWSGLFHDTIDNNLFWGYGFNGTKDLIDQLGLITRTAHNVFLEVFVTTGLVGLIFTIVFICFLWHTFSRYSFQKNHIFNSSLTAIITFLVMGQFDLKFSSSKFLGTIAFFLGMLYSQRVEKRAVDNELKID